MYTRLRDFTVYVDEEKQEAGSGVVCVTVDRIGNGATVEYNCSEPVMGRYVTVFQRNEILTICDLQVMAVKAPGQGEKASKTFLPKIEKNGSALCV